jgi:hypothetical protein
MSVDAGSLVLITPPAPAPAAVVAVVAAPTVAAAPLAVWAKVCTARAIPVVTSVIVNIVPNKKLCEILMTNPFVVKAVMAILAK